LHAYGSHREAGFIARAPETNLAGAAKAQKEYEGMPFEITIEKIEPERLFSFRWQQMGADSAEPRW
jgi:hypothetical protein